MIIFSSVKRVAIQARLAKRAQEEFSRDFRFASFIDKKTANKKTASKKKAVEKTKRNDNVE
jgi:hypothetical protein